MASSSLTSSWAGGGVLMDQMLMTRMFDTPDLDAKITILTHSWLQTITSACGIDGNPWERASLCRHPLAYRMPAGAETCACLWYAYNQFTPRADAAEIPHHCAKKLLIKRNSH